MNGNFSSTEAIEDLKNAFRAGSLATAIWASKNVGIEDKPDDAHARLASHDFDQAPVVKRKKTMGWVARSSLKDAESVTAAMTTLADSSFVSSDTTIGNVIHRLAESPFIFTVTNSGIEGFICVSDLERHVVRAYFSMLTSQVEMLLAHVIRGRVDESVLVEKITARAIHSNGRSLQTQFLKAREAGMDTHPVEYLYLNQLIELLPKALPSARKKTMSAILRNLEIVNENRNYVAHAAKKLDPKNAANRLRRLDDAFEMLIKELPPIIAEIGIATLVKKPT